MIPYIILSNLALAGVWLIFWLVAPFSLVSELVFTKNDGNNRNVGCVDQLFPPPSHHYNSSNNDGNTFTSGSLQIHKYCVGMCVLNSVIWNTIFHSIHIPCVISGFGLWFPNHLRANKNIRHMNQFTPYHSFSTSNDYTTSLWIILLLYVCVCIIDSVVCATLFLVGEPGFD